MYPVPQRYRTIQWIRIKRRLFTRAECDALVRLAESKGRYYKSAGKSITRKVEIRYVGVQNVPWAYKKLAETFATENVWGFVIAGIVEPLRIQKYKRGGYAGHHADYDYPSSDQSKITAIVPLVKRTSWRGGDFFIQGRRVRKALDVGDCLLFPSFAWHGVSRVHRGMRIVLSAWVAGPRLV